MKKHKSVAIVGAGPAGSTIARVMAEKGYSVSVFEKRDHVGGNCFDKHNDDGVLIHPYGPHYFRANCEDLLSWLSRFTKWRSAQYLVRANVDGELLPLPISLSTMIQMTGEMFNEDKLQQYLDLNTHTYEKPKNAEEHCLKKVGSELYEKIFKNYSTKQWGIPASELPSFITARIPLRFSFDERYPSEKFQVIPRDGYTTMFKNILNHKNIDVHLNSMLERSQIDELREEYDLMIYTGPIDLFFSYKYGRLKYRSLRFDWKTFDMAYKQPCVQINHPNEHDYTRTVEIKHVTGQICDNTTVCYEYPTNKGEPFYPDFSEENRKIYKQYQDLTKQELDHKCPTYFIGRQAEFRYYNMDHIFIHALNLAKELTDKD